MIQGKHVKPTCCNDFMSLYLPNEATFVFDVVLIAQWQEYKKGHTM